jgi:hypothetical protein
LWSNVTSKPPDKFARSVRYVLPKVASKGSTNTMNQRCRGFGNANRSLNPSTIATIDGVSHRETDLCELSRCAGRENQCLHSTGVQAELLRLRYVAPAKQRGWRRGRLEIPTPHSTLHGLASGVSEFVRLVGWLVGLLVSLSGSFGT